ncbi:MAG: immunoglobulin domain-containing protein [Patescibacteria group bacterium]
MKLSTRATSTIIAITIIVALTASGQAFAGMGATVEVYKTSSSVIVGFRLGNADSTGLLYDSTGFVPSAVTGWGIHLWDLPSPVWVSDQSTPFSTDEHGWVWMTLDIPALNVPQINNAKFLPFFQAGSTQWNFDSGAANLVVLENGVVTGVISPTDGNFPFSPGNMPTATAPVITANPTSITVDLGGQIQLGIGVQGVEPMTYQWKKDGVAISDATDCQYIKQAVSGDEGHYTCVVANPIGSVESGPAIVSIDGGTPTTDGTVVYTNAPGKLLISLEVTGDISKIFPGATMDVERLGAMLLVWDDQMWSMVETMATGEVSRQGNTLITAVKHPPGSQVKIRQLVAVVDGSPIGGDMTKVTARVTGDTFTPAVDLGSVQNAEFYAPPLPALSIAGLLVVMAGISTIARRRLS